VDRAAAPPLAGTRRRHAQAADVIALDLVRMRDELPAAAAAFRRAEQPRVDEAHKAPGARDRQQRLDAERLDLGRIEPVGLDHRLDVDKEKLENAPGFGQKEWPDFSDREYTGRIDQYYGASTRSDGTTAGATIRASELIGKNFDDAQGKEAGEVEDLIVDASSGRIGYAIVDFDDDWNEQADGKLVAIPLSSFALRGDKHDELVIQSSPDRIDLSHAFAKSQWPDFNDPAWQRASTAPRSQTSEPPVSQQTASASPRS